MIELFERKRTNPAQPHNLRHSQHGGQRDSSHGDPIRNAGHFIRGSQLIGHQLAMWMRGACVPPLFWLGIFLLISALKLAIILDEHELQMINMRGLSSFYDYRVTTGAVCYSLYPWKNETSRPLGCLFFPRMQTNPQKESAEASSRLNSGDFNRRSDTKNVIYIIY
jgi:hypothetical protein